MATIGLKCGQLSLVRYLKDGITSASNRGSNSDSLKLFITNTIHCCPESMMLRNLIQKIIRVVLCQPRRSRESPPEEPDKERRLATLVDPFTASIRVPLVQAPASPLTDASDPLSQDSSMSNILMRSEQHRFLSCKEPSRLDQAMSEMFEVPLRNMDSNREGKGTNYQTCVDLEMLMHNIL